MDYDRDEDARIEAHLASVNRLISYAVDISTELALEFEIDAPEPISYDEQHSDDEHHPDYLPRSE